MRDPSTTLDPVEAAGLISDWGFRYPGIADVEHVYFYAATTAAPETIKGFLERAHDLGRHFERPAPDPTAPAPHSP